MSVPVRRPIILKTLYRSNADIPNNIIVLTYKIDPRGEEYFAEATKHDEVDLKEMFLHRVACYSGEGTHVPIVNTRIALDIITLKTLMTTNLNIMPRTVDYKNPCVSRRRNDEEIGRLSLCEVGLITPSRSEPVLENDMLSRIFKDSEIEKLPRRPRRDPTIAPTSIVPIPATSVKASISDTRIRYNESRRDIARPSTSKSLDSAIAKISSSLTPTQWSLDEQIDIFKKTAVSLCIQKNLAYDLQALPGESDPVLTRKYLQKVVEYASTTCGCVSKFTPPVSQLATLVVLVINMKCEIIQVIPNSAQR